MGKYSSSADDELNRDILCSITSCWIAARIQARQELKLLVTNRESLKMATRQRLRDESGDQIVRTYDEYPDDVLRNMYAEQWFEFQEFRRNSLQENYIDILLKRNIWN